MVQYWDNPNSITPTLQCSNLLFPRFDFFHRLARE